MLLVSEVEETEIFKICLEYWNHLAAELYRESPFSTSSTPLLSDVPPRRHLYLPVLSQVTHVQTLSENLPLGNQPYKVFDRNLNFALTTCPSLCIYEYVIEYIINIIKSTYPQWDGALGITIVGHLV